ncbi:MAG: hypothetical protein MJ166_00005, partial [Clostridia bacterium]|nr:hypothetical protein [Clostridia bacterium]
HGDSLLILVSLETLSKKPSLQAWNAKWWEHVTDTQEKPYKLSISIGYAALDLKNQSMNDFMNTIDKKMYENKAAYYEARGNDRRKR